jgi:hypothetical protein
MVFKIWGKAPYQITYPNGKTRVVVLSGRVRWAVEELRKAGLTGRTGREAFPRQQGATGMMF